MSRVERPGPPVHARPITVEISRFWSPEEALAVFELIDDIRNKILALHGDQLREALKDQRGRGDSLESDEAGDVADEDWPF
jgi:hypothetical protein